MSDLAAALAATHALAFEDTRSWSADEFRSLLADPSVFHIGDAACFLLVSTCLLNHGMGVERGAGS